MLTIQIQPVVSGLETIDYNKTFFFNISGMTYEAIFQGQGIVLIIITYTISIQDQQLTIQFSPSTGSQLFQTTQNFSTLFVVNPNNNIEAIYYNNSVYVNIYRFESTAIVITSLGLFVLAQSLFYAKYIGI